MYPFSVSNDNPSQSVLGCGIKAQLFSLLATLALVVSLPFGAQADPVTASCISGGDPLGANSTFTVDLQLLGNEVGPMAIYSGRTIFDSAQMDLIGIDAIETDGFLFPSTPPFFTVPTTTGAGTEVYSNFSAASEDDSNPMNGSFVRLTFEKQGVAGLPDLQIVPNPDVTNAMLDPENTPIDATWIFANTCTPATVFYQVVGNATLSGETVTVLARVADGIAPLGGFGFTLEYDDAVLSPVAVAEPADATPFNFGSMSTVYEVGSVNIAGTIGAVPGDPANGDLFQMDFTVLASPVSIDQFGIPEGLELTDNAGITDPLIDLDNNDIFHVFAKEGTPPPLAQVVYHTEGDPLNSGNTFTLVAELPTNPNGQSVGALGFSLLFDPAELEVIGVAENVDSSAIQFEQLVTDEVVAGQVNIAGTISDPSNSSVTGGLFQIELRNKDVSLPGDLSCMPASLVLVDNSDVDQGLVELGSDSNTIFHEFVRGDSCILPQTIFFTAETPALLPGAEFEVLVSAGPSETGYLIGGFGFQVIFDPTEFELAGSVENIDGSPIQFESLSTVEVGPGIVNVAGTVADEANSATEGPMFALTLRNVGVVPVMGSDCYPVSLVVGDNPGVVDPLIALNPNSTPIAHNFAQGPFTCPEPVDVVYSVEGDTTLANREVQVLVSAQNSDLGQLIGGFGFTMTFDPAEFEVVQDAEPVDGSLIIPDQLTTFETAPGTLNIAGIIADAANTAPVGDLFVVTLRTLASGINVDSNCFPLSLMLDDNSDVDEGLIDLADGPIIHEFLPGTSVCPDPVDVLYGVDQYLYTNNQPFNVVVAAANATQGQLIGGVGFTVTFDPSEMALAGDALNIDGSPIQFDQLTTTEVSPGVVNVAGIISDEANTALEGGLFLLALQTVTADVDFDSDCFPINLVVDDNPTVLFGMVELDDVSTPIAHEFMPVPSCPQPMDVLYGVDQFLFANNQSFKVVVGADNSVYDQLIGGFGFQVMFDPAEMAFVSGPENVDGSPIQFDQLTVVEVSPGLLNVAGIVSDEENSAAEGALFALDFRTLTDTIAVTDCVPDSLMVGDNAGVDFGLVALDGISSPIFHQFAPAPSCPEPIEVLYGTEGAPLLPGHEFDLVARIDVNTQPVGGLAFQVTFDPALFALNGSAENVEESLIQFEQLQTVEVAPGVVNIAGLISDIGSSSPVGGLFFLPLVNLDVALPGDADCLPISLMLMDNSDVDFGLVELDDISSPIFHEFVREESCVLAEVVYRMDGNILEADGTADLAVRVEDNEAEQVVGAFSFTLTFDPALIDYTGDAIIDDASAIQTEQLITTEIGPGVVNVAGVISDPGNSAPTGVLFLMPFANQGVEIAAPAECLPIVVEDNADVTYALVELDDISTPIAHEIIREDSCFVAEPTAEIVYITDAVETLGGDTFNLVVSAQSAVDYDSLGGFDLTVSYNPAVTYFEAGTLASAGDSGLDVATVELGPGSIQVIGSAPVAPPPAEGVLFNLEFVNAGAVSINDCMPSGMSVADTAGVDALTTIDAHVIGHTISTPQDRCDGELNPTATISYAGLGTGSTFDIVFETTATADFNKFAETSLVIPFDPLTMQPVAGAVALPIPGSPIQFADIQTTSTLGTVFIHAYVDEATTSSLGGLFTMAFELVDDRVDLNDCLPPNMSVQGVTMNVDDPNFTSVQVQASHGVMCDRLAPEADVLYTVDCADPLNPGNAFNVVTILDAPVDFDGLSEYNITLEFDSATLAVTGDAMNVPGSPFQFTDLVTTLDDGEVIVRIFSPEDIAANSGALFMIGFENLGAQLTSTDGTGLPDSLLVKAGSSLTTDDGRVLNAQFVRTAGVVPENKVFEYLTDEEGWAFFVNAPFGNITGAYNATAGAIPGALDMTTSSNNMVFGYYEYPDPAGPAPTPVYTEEAPYRVTYNMSSNVDAADMPVIRLRASSMDFRRSELAVVSSRGDASLSPGVDGKVYTQWAFLPVGTVEDVRFDIDILNVDPANAEATTTTIDRVSIEAIDPAILGTPESVVSYDFTSANTNGWTARDAGIPAPEVMEATDEGLLMRGEVIDARDIDNDPTSIVAFGYWGFESDVAMEANKLYCMEFTVASDVDPSNVLAVPAFRLRLNEETVQFAAVSNVESMPGNDNLPSTDGAVTYKLWFQSPTEIDGTNMIFSFDYLYVNTGNPSDVDDPTIALILSNLNVVNYDIPDVCNF